MSGVDTKEMLDLWRTEYERLTSQHEESLAKMMATFEKQIVSVISKTEPKKPPPVKSPAALWVDSPAKDGTRMMVFNEEAVKLLSDALGGVESLIGSLSKTNIRGK